MHQSQRPTGPGAANTPGWSLAVDFGTSNTSAAHTNPVDGQVETLALQHRGATIPSAVYVESPDRIDVGDVAADRAQANPAGFLASPKRAIPHGEVTVNGYDLPASVPVAAVLDAVLRRAVAAHNGALPSRLVLTHPEDWSPREIGVLRDAAARLALPSTSVEAVSEPRAAAHYYARSRTVAPGSRIAVFDFGGGTLDVAVLSAGDDGDFEVVAARGDNGLGGKNFDAALRRWLDEQVDNRDPDLLTHVRSAAPMHERLALDESIRRAKELLSEAPSATITVPGPGGPEHFHITREEFEEVIEPALERALSLTRSALSGAGPVDALYLTGGSSRIPIVHERLKGLAEIATLDDPKTVVSRGALGAETLQLHAGSAAPAADPRGAIPPGAPTTTPAPAQTAAARPTLQMEIPADRRQDAPTAGFDPTAGSSRRRLGLGLAAAAAVVVLAAVGVGGYLFLADDDSSATDLIANSQQEAPGREDVGGGQDATGQGGAQTGGQGAGTPDAAQAAAPTGSGAVDTEDAARAALPTALGSAVTSCRRMGETGDGAVELLCELDPDSPLVEGLFTPEYPIFTFNVDQKQAQRSVVSIRQRMRDSTAVEINEIVENTARTAAASISGDPGESFQTSYSNGTTGVNLMVQTSGVDAATAFLTRAGLLS